jgi:hypothetical protein
VFAIVLRYGAISGAVVIAVIIAGMVYADGVGGGHGHGFTSLMVRLPRS